MTHPKTSRISHDLYCLCHSHPTFPNDPSNQPASQPANVFRTAYWADVLDICMVRIFTDIYIVVTVLPLHLPIRKHGCGDKRTKHDCIFFFFSPLLSVFLHFHTSLFLRFLHYFGRRGFRQGSGGRSGQSYIMISNLFSSYFSCSCSLLILTPMLFLSLPDCALFGHTVYTVS